MKSSRLSACVAISACCVLSAFAQSTQESPSGKNGAPAEPAPSTTPPPSARVAAAGDLSSVSAPTLDLGDRWTWDVIVKPEDNCTTGIPSGAQEVETITRVGAEGHNSRIVGPQPDSQYSRSYAKDGSYRAVLDGKEVRSTPVAFPLRPGNTWETTFVGNVAVQSLQCKVEASERIKVGDQLLDVFPITCEGRWRNRQYGNSDKAVYKYWYSPSVGASVRRTVLTWYNGRHCADIEYRLASYVRSK